MSDFDRVH
jgi:hypothetical protein